MKQFDWSQPQRQPLAGLAIAFLNTFWQILKAFWPLLVVMLIGGNKENAVNRYEIMGIGFLVITVLAAVFRFIFFRFYIDDGKLVIKSGWIKKITKVIPLERIQSVHIEQGPLHQMLHIVKLTIDTAGSQQAEASIDALHKSMAAALRTQLLSEKTTEGREEQQAATFREPVLNLSGKDLLKLSISANHLEAFFILLSFGFGLYDNLKNIDNNLFSGIEEQFPRSSFYPILFLVIAVLLITILVSTARIFFGFYDFAIFRTVKGFQIRSGLINVKERLIPIQKIQFISWKANWIRRRMQLWMLECHISGTDELKNKQKVNIPVTQDRYIPVLVNEYQPMPETAGLPTLRMHPGYVFRRFLIVGLFPLFLLAPLAWLWLGNYVVLILIYPLTVLIIAWCRQKKFRLWAFDEQLFIRRGIFGEEWILMQWHKIQSVRISQSVFQRRKNIASLLVQTAAGPVHIPYIDVKAARELADFMLYKTERSNKSWL